METKCKMESDDVDQRGARRKSEKRESKRKRVGEREEQRELIV